MAAAQKSGDPLWDPTWTDGAGEKTIQEHASGDGAAVKMYCSWFCPFAQRAWIALEEKGVSYKYVEINPYEVDMSEPGGYTKKQLPLSQKKKLYPDFIAASPKGLVPAIEHAGKKLWESIPIVEYIDESFSGPALLPSDPYLRAQVRIWSEHCESKIQRSFYTLLIDQNPEAQEKARTEFFSACRTLSTAMQPGGGPFFLGAQFSMLDIVLAPFWQRFIWMGTHYRDLKFPKEEPFERLNRWWDAVSTRPSVAKTIVCRPRMVSSYSQYSRNVATSDFAKQMQSSLSSNSKLDLNQNGTSSKMFPARMMTSLVGRNPISFGVSGFVLGMITGVAASAMILSRSSSK